MVRDAVPSRQRRLIKVTLPKENGVQARLMHCRLISGNLLVVYRRPVMRLNKYLAMTKEALPSTKNSRWPGKVAFFTVIIAVLLVVRPHAAMAQSAEEKHKEAASAFDRGDFEQAVGLYEQALKLQPDSVTIRTDLAVALVRLGRYAEAIADYEEVLKHDPENAIVRLNLALAWYKQAEFAKAAEELRNLRAKHSDNRQALYLLADCYLRLGKNADVVALLQPEYAANPGDLAVDYALGTALIRQGQIHEGEVVIDRILKAGDTPEANLLMGEAQFAVGDYNVAATT